MDKAALKVIKKRSATKLKAERTKHGLVEFRRWVSPEERVLLNKFCNMHGMIKGRTSVIYDKNTDNLVRALLAKRDKLESST